MGATNPKYYNSDKIAGSPTIPLSEHRKIVSELVDRQKTALIYAAVLGMIFTLTLVTAYQWAVM